MLVPAVTLVTPSLLVIVRSALVLTVSVSVAVLLAAFGSVVVALTLAELTCGPAVVPMPDGVSHADRGAAAVMVPSAQVKSPCRCRPVPGAVIVLARVKPAGQLSVMLTPVAVEGPALLTVIVYGRT